MPAFGGFVRIAVDANKGMHPPAQFMPNRLRVLQPNRPPVKTVIPDSLILFTQVGFLKRDLHTLPWSICYRPFLNRYVRLCLAPSNYNCEFRSIGSKYIGETPDCFPLSEKKANINNTASKKRRLRLSSLRQEVRSMR